MIRIRKRQRTDSPINLNQEIMRTGKSATGRNDCGSGEIDSHGQRPGNDIKIDFHGAARAALLRAPAVYDIWRLPHLLMKVFVKTLQPTPADNSIKAT